MAENAQKIAAGLIGVDAPKFPPLARLDELQKAMAGEGGEDDSESDAPPAGDET